MKEGTLEKKLIAACADSAGRRRSLLPRLDSDLPVVQATTCLESLCYSDVPPTLVFIAQLYCGRTTRGSISVPRPGRFSAYPRLTDDGILSHLFGFLRGP